MISRKKCSILYIINAILLKNALKQKNNWKKLPVPAFGESTPQSGHLDLAFY